MKQSLPRLAFALGALACSQLASAIVVGQDQAIMLIDNTHSEVINQANGATYISSGATVDHFHLHDQSYGSIDGGETMYINQHGASRVEMSGGFVFSATTYGQSIFEADGGMVSTLRAHDNSVLRLTNFDAVLIDLYDSAVLELFSLKNSLVNLNIHSSDAIANVYVQWVKHHEIGSSEYYYGAWQNGQLFSFLLNGDRQANLNFVGLTDVPEPSALLLSLLGIAGLGVARRQRRA